MASRRLTRVLLASCAFCAGAGGGAVAAEPLSASDAFASAFEAFAATRAAAPVAAAPSLSPGAAAPADPWSRAKALAAEANGVVAAAPVLPAEPESRSVVDRLTGLFSSANAVTSGFAVDETDPGALGPARASAADPATADPGSDPWSIAAAAPADPWSAARAAADAGAAPAPIAVAAADVPSDAAIIAGDTMDAASADADDAARALETADAALTPAGEEPTRPPFWARDPVVLVAGDPFLDGPIAAPSAAAPSLAGMDQLTIAELFSFVLAENIELRIESERIAARRLDIDIAETAYNPTLDLEAGLEAKRARDGSNSHEDTFTRQLSLIGRQTLYDFGATRYDVARASETWRQAVQRTEAKTEDVALEIVEAILGVEQTDATLAALNQTIEAHERILDLVRAAADEGAATLADVKRVESRLDAARTTRINLETQRNNAANQFERLTLMPIDRVRLGALERVARAAPVLPEDAYAGSPELATIDHEIAALRNQYRRAQRQLWPTVDLETSASLSIKDEASNQEQRQAAVSLLFAMPLYDGGVNARTREQLLAQIREAELRRVRAERELREEAENTARFEESEAGKAEVLRDQVEALERVAEIAVDQFAAGQRSLLELLESEADLLTARVDETTHRYDRMRSAFRALKLAGVLSQTLLDG